MSSTQLNIGILYFLDIKKKADYAMRTFIEHKIQQDRLRKLKLTGAVNLTKRFSVVVQLTVYMLFTFFLWKSIQEQQGYLLRFTLSIILCVSSLVWALAFGCMLLWTTSQLKVLQAVAAKIKLYFNRKVGLYLWLSNFDKHILLNVLQLAAMDKMNYYP